RRAGAARAITARGARLLILQLARARRVAGARLGRARIRIVGRRHHHAMAGLAGRVAGTTAVRAGALAADPVLAGQARGALAAGRARRGGHALRLASPALTDGAAGAIEVARAAGRADATGRAHVDPARGGERGGAAARAVAAGRAGLRCAVLAVRAARAAADRAAARIATGGRARGRALATARRARAGARRPRAVRIPGRDLGARPERCRQIARHALLRAGRVATDAVDTESGLALVAA